MASVTRNGGVADCNCRNAGAGTWFWLGGVLMSGSSSSSTASSLVAETMEKRPMKSALRASEHALC